MTTSTVAPATATSGIDSIAADGARELVQSDPAVRFIDVRTSGEYAGVHIPGSYNIPLDTLGEHAAELAAMDHPVVIVCRSGARAEQAHTKLARAGKGKMHVLTGGIEAWESSGGDVVRGGGSEVWAMDRQVRLVAGSIALAGILASVVVPKSKWLAGGVGAGLAFSAATNTCAMGTALSKLPYNKSDDCDVDRVITELKASS